MTQTEQRLPPPGPIRAPYNFVPFPDQVIIPYQQNAGRPRYSDSITDFLSGQIRITVTAQTPVIISEGRGSPSKDSPIPFCTGSDGTPCIPGSTIRGLLRSNMTILGFGSAQNGSGFLNSSPYFREIWDPEKEAETFNRNLYRQKLGIKSYSIPDSEKRYSIPTRVFGGWLYCNRHAQGFIRPVKEQVYHISREDPMVKPWANRYAMYEPVWYQAEGPRVALLLDHAFPGGSPGYIFSPAWKKNQRSLYLFPEADMQAPAIPLPEDRILEYQHDFDRRKGKLRGTNPEHPADPAFWAIPQDIRTPKPVFYHVDSGRVNFGMSRFLRLDCARSLLDCLPEAHQKRTISDYPSAVFGSITGKRSLGSRVSVGDCRANGKPDSQTAALYLHRPNTAFGVTYLKDEKTFNHPDATLRGYKHYWLKDPIPSEKNKTVSFHAMPPGTSFSGVIRYHHLRPDELGLLLWCIRLEEGCYHSIGRGKPYGYGRIHMQIDGLYEYDPDQLYHSLAATPQPCEALTQRVEELIRCYEQEAKNLLGCPQKSLLEYPHIQDFLYMKSTIRTDMDQVDYMQISKGFNEFEHHTGPLPTVQQIREQNAAVP